MRPTAARPGLMATTGPGSTDLVAKCALVIVAAYKATLRVGAKPSTMFGSFQFRSCRRHAGSAGRS
jgi:hypothetical protein